MNTNYNVMKDDLCKNNKNDHLLIHIYKKKTQHN